MSSASCANRAPRCCWSNNCWKRRLPPPIVSMRWCRARSCWKRRPARTICRSGWCAPISVTKATRWTANPRHPDKEQALKILLTPTPEFRRQYYGERSLKGLQALGQVRLHEGRDALDANGLIEAASDVDIIVA